MSDTATSTLEGALLLAHTAKLSTLFDAIKALAAASGVSTLDGKPIAAWLGDRQQENTEKLLQGLAGVDPAEAAAIRKYFASR